MKIAGSSVKSFLIRKVFIQSFFLIEAIAIQISIVPLMQRQIYVITKTFENDRLMKPRGSSKKSPRLTMSYWKQIQILTAVAYLQVFLRFGH